MDPLIPLAPAPERIIPDFYSMTSLQVTLAVVFSTTFTVATILLGMRLYTNIYITKQVGWDAVLIVLSWLASLGFFVIMLIVFPAGFGRHYYEVSVQQMQNYLHLLAALSYTYIWPPTLAKLSLLIIYYRLDKHMGFRFCTHLTGVLVLVPTLVITILLSGPCNPETGDLQCLNSCVITQTVTNIASDVVLIAMPMQMILRLNMPKRQKIALGCLLTLGSFVVVISIIRTAFVQTFVTDPDVTYTQAYVGIWSCLELNFGVICNCLAMLHPFVRMHMPWLARKIMRGGASADGRRPPHQSSAARHNHNNDDDDDDDELITIGKKSVRRGLRCGVGDSHSYILHSMGACDVSLEVEEDEEKEVMTSEYRVDVDVIHQKMNGEGDTSSTKGNTR